MLENLTKYKVTNSLRILTKNKYIYFLIIFFHVRYQWVDNNAREKKKQVKISINMLMI